MSDHHIDAHGVADTLFLQGKYKEALDKYRILADEGSVAAQLRIGWFYQKGLGVSIDLEEAYRWYKKAAVTDSPTGQFYMGVLQRAQKNYQEAFCWFEKAAAQDYVPAIYCLGEAYQFGEGVDVDRNKANKYFEKAAAMGHLLGQRRIAVNMIKGNRGITNIPRGLFMFARFMKSTYRLASEDPDSDLIRR